MTKQTHIVLIFTHSISGWKLTLATCLEIRNPPNRDLRLKFKVKLLVLRLSAMPRIGPQNVENVFKITTPAPSPWTSRPIPDWVRQGSKLWTTAINTITLSLSVAQIKSQLCNFMISLSWIMIINLTKDSYKPFDKSFEVWTTQTYRTLFHVMDVKPHRYKVRSKHWAFISGRSDELEAFLEPIWNLSSMARKLSKKRGQWMYYQFVTISSYSLTEFRVY